MYGIIIHNIEIITQEATLKDQHGGTRLGIVCKQVRFESL